MLEHQAQGAGAAAGGIMIGGHPLRDWLRAGGVIALMLLPVALISWPFALAVFVLGTGSWLALIVGLKAFIAFLDWLLGAIDRLSEMHPTVVALRAQAAEATTRQADENERWKRKRPEAYLDWARSKHSEHLTNMSVCTGLISEGKEEFQVLLDFHRERVAHWETEIAQWEAFILAARPDELSPAAQEEQRRLLKR